MAGRDLAQGRLLLRAARHDVRAARVEAAAGRRVERRRHLAGQHDLLVLTARSRRQHGGEQRLGVGVARRRRTAPAVGAVLDDLAEIHHRRVVGHVAHRGEVVRDQQIGDVVCAWMSFSRFIIWARIDTSSADTGSSSTISCGSRGERCRQRDALALAAAELVRILARLLAPQPDLARSSSRDPRRRSLARSPQPVTISDSAIVRPTVMRGLSDDHGSWNTACTLARYAAAPRPEARGSARRRAARARRSAPRG